jgi:hypothetical protein
MESKVTGIFGILAPLVADALWAYVVWHTFSRSFVVGMWVIGIVAIVNILFLVPHMRKGTPRLLEFLGNEHEQLQEEARAWLPRARTAKSSELRAIAAVVFMIVGAHASFIAVLMYASANRPDLFKNNVGLWISFNIFNPFWATSVSLLPAFWWMSCAFLSAELEWLRVRLDPVRIKPPSSSQGGRGGGAGVGPGDEQPPPVPPSIAPHEAYLALVHLSFKVRAVNNILAVPVFVFAIIGSCLVLFYSALGARALTLAADASVSDTKFMTGCFSLAFVVSAFALVAILFFPVVNMDTELERLRVSLNRKFILANLSANMDDGEVAARKAIKSVLSIEDDEDRGVTNVTPLSQSSFQSSSHLLATRGNEAAQWTPQEVMNLKQALDASAVRVTVMGIPITASLVTRAFWALASGSAFLIGVSIDFYKVLL